MVALARPGQTAPAVEGPGSSDGLDLAARNRKAVQCAAGSVED